MLSEFQRTAAMTCTPGERRSLNKGGPIPGLERSAGDGVRAGVQDRRRRPV